MSGPGKNQVFEWDADAAKVILTITETSKKIRELTKVARDHNKAIAEGKEVSQETQEATLKALTLELNQREKLRAKLKEMRGEQDKNNDSMRLANARILMVSYAIDDFITVSNQGDWSAKSMAGGLAAAANNMSVLLATVNPWLAIVPAVIAGFAKIGASAFESGEDVEAAKNKFEEAIKLGQQMIQQADEVGLAADQVAENKRQEEVAKALDAKAQQIRDLLAQQQELRDTNKPVFIPGGEAGGDIMIERPNDKAIANLRTKIDNAERERAKIREADQKLKAEFERKKAENERKKMTEEGMKNIGPMRDMLVSVADQILQAETDPEAAKKIPLPGKDANERMDSLLKMFQVSPEAMPDIKASILKEVEAKRIEEMTKPKPSPVDLRLKEIQEKKLELEVKREEAELASPTGKLPPFRQPEFDREFDKLERDRKQAELDKREEQRHRENMSVNEKAAEGIQTLIRIMERRPAPVGGANR